MSTPSIFSAIQKLRAFFTRQEKWQWISIAGFAVCNSMLEVATATIVVIFAQVLNQPEIGQKYILKLGLGKNLSSNHIIFYIAIICGVVYFIKNLIATAEIFYQNFSIQKMNYRFKNKLLYRYAEVDYGFYLTRNSSLGMQVVSGDVELMFSSGAIALATILSESIVLICLVAMIVAMNPSLALIVFATGSIFGLIISKWILPLFYQWGRKQQEAALYSHQNLLQFFHAFKEIILLGKREAFINSYKLHSRKKSKVHAVQTATNALPRIVMEVLFVGLFVTTVMYLCLKHENSVQMIGVLGGYLYAGFRLMPGLNRIINQLNIFKSVIPSIEKVYEEYFMVTNRENCADVPSFEFKDSIVLRGVSFHYLNTKKSALNHINLEIKKGECIGIVGETGSGKSTLVDIILGLLKPCEGSVLVDSQHPVNSYQWHRLIGYVPQSIYLIDDTIEANIALGEKAEEVDQVKIEHAIDKAQLKSFIKHLPNGSKTIVGERGIRLSGGEKQRISIARALYRNPEVLIFDEATSALDNETEAQLMKVINTVSQNCTVIMIAHRLSTLKNCDKIIAMKNGRIEEIKENESFQRKPAV
jgi:ATP-binding cassette subfamily C protein